jgi:hypothetical protein
MTVTPHYCGFPIEQRRSPAPLPGLMVLNEEYYGSTVGG